MVRISASTHAFHIFGTVGDDFPLCDFEATPVVLPRDYVPPNTNNDDDDDDDESSNDDKQKKKNDATTAAIDPSALKVRGKRYLLVGTGIADDDLDSELHYVINFWPVVPGAVYTISPVAVATTNTQTTNDNDDGDDNDAARPNSKDGANPSAPAADHHQSGEDNKNRHHPIFTRPLQVRTPRSPFKNQHIVVLTDKDEVANPGIVDLLPQASLAKDYIFVFEPEHVTAPSDTTFLARCFWNSLFLLPHQDSPVSLMPNANRRFCIDLEQPTSQKWLSSKKCRKHLSEFTLTVAAEFEDLLRQCMKYHVEKNESTWLDDEFIHTLQVMARDPNVKGKIQNMSFVLRERNSGKVAAATFGFAAGSTFHDYTMCTLMRDRRSCGILVTKLVGMILQAIGMKLWYWGLKSKGTAYMNDFQHGGYAGCELDNDEFCQRWAALRDKQLPKPMMEAVAEVCASIKLPVFFA